MHISSAAIIVDGKIICASPEERFNRIKMSTDFPTKSIEWCLKYAKLKSIDGPVQKDPESAAKLPEVIQEEHSKLLHNSNSL